MGSKNTIKEPIIKIILVGITAFSVIFSITLILILKNTVDPRGWFPKPMNLPGFLMVLPYDVNARDKTLYS